MSLYGTPKEEVAPAQSTTSRSVPTQFASQSSVQSLTKILKFCPHKTDTSFTYSASFLVLHFLKEITVLALFDNFNTFGTLYTFNNNLTNILGSQNILESKNLGNSKILLDLKNKKRQIGVHREKVI